LNSELAKNVVMLFSEAAPHSRESISGYTEQDWRETKPWLDATGVALYFLARIKCLAIEDAIPASILAELEQNAADRQLQVKQRFEEFASIVQAFAQADVRFAVEKGFALVPDYCPDISLRFQMDFDFLVDRKDVARCRELLERLKYSYMGAAPGELRFKKGEMRHATLSEIYKSRPHQLAELHFSDSQDDEKTLSSTEIRVAGLLSFPVLSKLDFFCSHARHTCKHIRGGWVRTDALLEYRQFLLLNANDHAFWLEIQRRCTLDSELSSALSLVALLAEITLGVSLPSSLQQVVNSVPPETHCWIDSYGWRFLLADFPGSKLSLILERELSPDRTSWWLQSVRRLIPSHMPHRIVAADGKPDSERRAFITRAWFFLNRSYYYLRQIAHFSYALPGASWLSWRSSRNTRHPQVTR
jgi:Uncharacterised nucleotidyltransferase